MVLVHRPRAPTVGLSRQRSKTARVAWLVRWPNTSLPSDCCSLGMDTEDKCSDAGRLEKGVTGKNGREGTPKRVFR